ncbi:ABC transporter substrate-binding protein [Bacillota bacterium Meth-B3]|nr:sugar ABC transporter substrate-binding protein [Christensenellaceae bacterium]MEA5065210.1 sugar ABC transporter substrate-binding protein [Eubacteriales bacterium]
MKKLASLMIALLMILSAMPLAAAEEPVTLTFAFWDTNQEPGMRAIAEAYTAKHPNVTIETQVTPWNEYWMKLEAGAMGGDMPDVMWMHANQIVKYVEAGTLLDLNDMNYDYSPYPEGVTKLYFMNDVHWAIPKDYDTIALAYNKEIFDAAGEAYPDDSWDWAKFREVAIKLTDKDKGVYGYGVANTGQSGYLNFIYQNEGFAFENGVAGFDQPATQEAMQFYADLLLKDGVSPTLESFADMNADDQFCAGKLAMLTVGSWMMSSYTQNELINGKFDLAVLPKGKVRASIYNGLGYAGAAGTKHPEVVKDFLAFCGTEEANKLQAEKKAAIPAYKGTEHYFTDLFDINIKCYPEMIEYGVQYPFSPRKSLWYDAKTEMMTSILSGQSSVADAANALQATITEAEAG